MPSLPSAIHQFLGQFHQNGFQIYAVGGTVRGILMGKWVSDWDFTTNATPEEIMKLFPHSFYENTFGTVGIPQKLDGTETVLEVTTYRSESGYSNARHPDTVTWATRIEDDLARRDFTINAIAFNGTDLVDPYDGQSDIQRKIIRCVGNPEIRFQEDALRLMRAVRQSAQLGFTIEAQTLSSIQANAIRILDISGERIRDEFLKLLASPNPAEGVLLLKTTGLLKHILPEVESCFGVDQVSPERHHIYDVGTHLVESLRHCPSQDPITRFATLIHDIGKEQTYRKDPITKIVTFYNHEVVGETMAEVIARRFKLSNNQKAQLVTLVRHHQFTVSEVQSDKAIRRFIRQIGVELVDEMLALRTGDRLGSGAKETSWRTELFKKRIEEVQYVPFTIKDLAVSGYDVMKKLDITPGPFVGKILEKLFYEVDEEQIPNDRNTLLSRLPALKKELESA